MKKPGTSLRAVMSKAAPSSKPAPKAAVSSEKSNFTVSLNSEIGRRAQAQAKLEGSNFSQVIGELLAGWLDGRFKLKK